MDDDEYDKYNNGRDESITSGNSNNRCFKCGEQGIKCPSNTFNTDSNYLYSIQFIMLHLFYGIYLMWEYILFSKKARPRPEAITSCLA